MLHSLSQDFFFFLTFFVFNINRKTNEFFLKQLYPKGFFEVRKGVLIVFLLPLKRSPENKVETLTLKKSTFFNIKTECFK